MSAKQIERIIERELEAAEERIQQQVRPIIQQAFDRLHAKYPSFERIIFGNGTYLFEFTQGSRYDDIVMKYGGMEDLPKTFDSLKAMCYEVSYDHPIGDVTPSG
jgi:hypothetical protein